MSKMKERMNPPIAIGTSIGWIGCPAILAGVRMVPPGVGDSMVAPPRCRKAPTPQASCRRVSCAFDRVLVMEFPRPLACRRAGPQTRNGHERERARRQGAVAG